MTYRLPLLPVPRVADEALRVYLERERTLLLHLVTRLNTLGCGLEFVNEALAVKLGDSTLECDGGLKVVTSALEHGALSGLADDDHLGYVSMTPEGDRNQMVIGEVNTPGLTIEAPTSYVAKYLQGLDSLLAETFSVGADGKGSFHDVDDAFADPNSHYQGSNDSLQARSEELGFALKEHTRFWSREGSPRRWNGHTTPSFRAALRTWGVACPDGSETTIAGGPTLVPAWYEAVGSTIFTVEVDWAVEAVPGSDQAVVFRVSFDAFPSGEAIAALTTVDTTIPLTTALTANAVYTTTVDITSGTIGSATFAHMEFKRMATAPYTNDTLAQTWYVLAIRIRSGVKYT